MDASSTIGLVLGWGAILVAFILEGGHIRGLLNPTAAMIVIGGTIGATVLSVPLNRSLSAPGLLRRAFFPRRADSMTIIDSLVALSGKARREGVLSLEADVEATEDDFMRKALRVIMDGSDPQVVKETLEAELETRNEDDAGGAGVFKTMGGYSPTLGVIGTVMGLIHMLSQLSEPGKMGPAIAAAFIATFYGVAFANLIFLPLADKLKSQNTEAARCRRLVLEGVLSIQGGVNPTALEERLLSFLPPAMASKRLSRAERGAAEESPAPAEAGATAGEAEAVG